MAAFRTLSLLALIAGVSCSQTSDCSYSGLLDHLNLATSSSTLQIARPVKNWTTTTVVQLDMILDAILDVDEKRQTVTSHIWIKMYWINEFLTWNSSEFCGMNMLTVPSSMLWNPDLIIQEDVSDDENSDDSSLVHVLSSGLVRMTRRLQLTYACKINLFRFPFDTQICNISFSSLNYEESLLKLAEIRNDSILTTVSEQAMPTCGEWTLVSIDTISYTFAQVKTKLVYRITLERKPFLYIVNLILPLMFLLVLDLASFFISDASGGKLGFKVTILLSIFVLLLILKDILPSTEDTLPLMAIYCVLVFGLVWISVLETMLMSFLRNLAASGGEEAHSSEREADNHKDPAGVAWTAKPEASDAPLEPPGDEGLLKLILNKVKAAQKTLERQKTEAGKCGCRMQRLVKISDSVFFVLYFAAVVISQVFMFILWKITGV